MAEFPLLKTTNYLDKLPIRVSTYCLKQNGVYHMHDHTQLCFGLSGTVKYNIRGQEYIQHPGSCAVFLPFVAHSTNSAHSDDTPVLIYISFFDEFLTENGYDYFPYGNNPRIGGLSLPCFSSFDSSKKSAATAIVHNMVNEFSKKRNMSYKSLAAWLYDLLCLIGTDACKSKVSLPEKKQIASIRNAVSYIEKHYPQKILIDDMCDITGMSRRVFTQHFKEITGMTFSHFLLSLRIESARKLFSTNTLYDDIAAQTGLYNHSNLARVFSKYLGFTPTEYDEHLFRALTAEEAISTATLYNWLYEEDGFEQ